MKYYDGHEAEYKRRLGAGQVAWDAGEYDEFDMRVLVDWLLAEADFAKGARALDLGCGTGGLACYLARQGFEVMGVDLAATAIEAGRGEAQKRGLKVEFAVGDVCEMDLGEGEFDLITDNHFLHCIVFDQERAKVLEKIRRALKAGGQYWLETMADHDQIQGREKWYMDEAGVTWMKGGGCEVKVEGAEKRDGVWWWPIRRILRPDVLRGELEKAGLVIDWWEVVGPMDENDTGVVRARCRNGV
ncbi:MAG: class I SAM-dependent methyltransferase [Sedimentisphaerales bacterium]|nr:class I SAM-dependent methyltransferase [Sedimentisphaerales bacterium]